MLLLASALLSLSHWAAAQPTDGESLDDPKVEAEAFNIAKRTMSPFCPGRTLADCPSGYATEWRQDIRNMLKQGKSAGEIQAILNERAGANLTGAPESSLGWALPVGLCLGALAVLTLVFRRFRSEDTSSSSTEAGRAKRRAGADRDEADEDELEDEAEDGEASEAARAGREQELEERLRRELADEDER